MSVCVYPQTHKIHKFFDNSLTAGKATFRSPAGSKATVQQKNLKRKLEQEKAELEYIIKLGTIAGGGSESHGASYHITELIGLTAP